MSKNPAQFSQINLLPEDPFFSTIMGRSLRWALTAGRYLVIFTELLVIVSFATRFKLDRQKTDLTNEIDHKMMVIESYGDVEDKVKSVQERLTYFKEVSHNKIDTDIFPYLNSLIPNGVTIDKLVITQDKISVSGTVRSQTAFNTLITNLQQSPRLDKVKVGKIEKNARSEDFDFQFTAKIILEDEVNKQPQEK